jgi:hypothetical protein
MHRRLAMLAVLAITPLLCAPFLYAQAKDLPDGKGKDKVVQFCTACHGTEEFISQKLSRKDWEDVIEDMKRKGLDLKKADYDEILEYLVAHFNEKSK